MTSPLWWAKSAKELSIAPSLSAACLVALLLWAQPALCAEIGVGLYAPELPFAGPAERHSLVKHVAQHLSRALRRPVDALAYLNEWDLRRDLRARRMQFAIVGPHFASTLSKEQILALARLGVEGVGDWSIFCKSKRTLQSLEGSRLQIPRMGPQTIAFVQRLLAGTAPKSLFKIQRSPDIMSAVRAVRLDQAEAVIAPLSIRKRGLVPILDKPTPMAPPAFVVLDLDTPPEVVSKARKVLLSYTVKVAMVHGWYDPAVEQASPKSKRERRSE